METHPLPKEYCHVRPLHGSCEAETRRSKPSRSRRRSRNRAIFFGAVSALSLAWFSKNLAKKHHHPDGGLSSERVICVHNVYMDHPFAQVRKENMPYNEDHFPPTIRRPQCRSPTCSPCSPSIMGHHRSEGNSLKVSPTNLCWGGLKTIPTTSRRLSTLFIRWRPRSGARSYLIGIVLKG